MPTNKTIRDWAYRFFAASRSIDTQNANVIGHDVMDGFVRFASESQDVLETRSHIAYGLATSIYPQKGKTFGFKVQGTDVLLSDLLLEILLNRDDEELTQLFTGEYSSNEWYSALVITMLAFTAFERVIEREINRGKLIYAKEVVSFKLYTYQLVANLNNYALLSGELLIALRDLLESVNRLTDINFVWRDRLIYGIVDTKHEPYTILGLRLADRNILLTDILSNLEFFQMPSFIKDKFKLNSSETWTSLMYFILLFMMAFETYAPEIERQTIS